MISNVSNNESSKSTSHRVVLPFYVYAAISFLASTILLLTSSEAFLGHYFHPQILAITHIMALGWGTMIILGASHQLVPVLIEGKLYSNKLAYMSFIFAAVGIPFLVYGFYTFDMGLPSRLGGYLILSSILSYIVNLGASISKGKHTNIHAAFVFTASVWFFVTAVLGLTLVYNFNSFLLPHDSLHYLPLHAHTGIIGWFLLLVIGVASRLIPMFLISKYTNSRLLRWMYLLINGALVVYILIFCFTNNSQLIFLPVIALFIAISLFIYYCYYAFKQRLRKQVDAQIKMSLLSALMTLIPVLMLFVIIFIFSVMSTQNNKLVLTYGFLVLFGWITAIALGMTYKTLPFIIWNRVYHRSSGKTPNPKDLFSKSVFKTMSITYILGLLIFVSGILSGYSIVLIYGAALLLISSILYTFNVLKLITHKANTV